MAAATLTTKLVKNTVVAGPTTTQTWSEAPGTFLDLINPSVPLATPEGGFARAAIYIGVLSLLMK